MCSDESDGTCCTSNLRQKGRTRSYHLATWPTYSRCRVDAEKPVWSKRIDRIRGHCPRTPVTRMLSHLLMRWLRGWVSEQKGEW